MTDIKNLIVDNLDIWTSAVKKKSATGRGSSKKIELLGLKKLRQLILELAVRGELVAQNPNDEPASVLLEKIAKEKAQFIAQKKTKKQKPLAKITDEEKPFELPSGWQWSKLSSISNFVNGYAFKSNDFTEKGIGVVKIGDIQNGEISSTSMSRLPKSVVDKLDESFKVHQGDLLIAMSGATTGKLGFNKSDELYFLNQRVGKIQAMGLSLEYLYLQLTTKISENLSKAIGSAIPNISTTQINAIVIAVPPLVEQKRIVAKVDELMAICDKLEKQSEQSLSAHQELVFNLLSSLTTSQSSNLDKTTKPTKSLNLNSANIPNPTIQKTENLQSKNLNNENLKAQKLGFEHNSFLQNWQYIKDNFDLLFTTENSIEQLKQTILELAVRGKLVAQNPNDEPASVLLEKIAKEKAQLIAQKKIKKQKPLAKITDEEKPFALPSGWQWCRFSDIGELARGKSKHRPRNDPNLYTDGTIKLVQTGDVARSNGIIVTHTALYNEMGLAQSRLWLEGTMCITIAANIADTGILGFNACFPDSIVGFSPFIEQINVKYFEYFVRTTKSNLEAFAPATAQKNINLEILSQILVPLPPLAEQKRIVAKVDELFAICDKLKNAITCAQNTKSQLADSVVKNALSPKT